MKVALDDVSFIGAGLNRPECVVAHPSGWLYVSDWTAPGGVAAIAPDGAVTRFLATEPDPNVPTPLKPNGFALEPDGAFLIAHLGETSGGVYRLRRSGRCSVVADKIRGAPIPPSNFLLRETDAEGDTRLWLTVSTTVTPRAADYQPNASSGFIARIEDDGAATIVADGLGYTNECVIDPDGRTLFVNETFARRLTAFDIRARSLESPRVVARFGDGVFPDGLTLTEDGGFLVTSIVSNRVLRVAPDGRIDIVLEDADPKTSCDGGEGVSSWQDGAIAPRPRRLTPLEQHLQPRTWRSQSRSGLSRLSVGRQRRDLSVALPRRLSASRCSKPAPSPPWP